MNRRQAGFLAIGVLVVAVAIVVVGGLIRHARTPDVQHQASATAPASQSSQPKASAGTPAKQQDGTESAAATDKTAPAPSVSAPAKQEADAPAPAKPEQPKAADGAKTAAQAGNADQAASPVPPKAGSAAEPAAPAADGGDSPSVAAAGPDASAPSAKGPSEATAGQTAAPTFDILRVEPDGSTVIAGRAEPNARVDVMSGDKKISSTNAGEAGDFVTVLDPPLAPGNYELKLKAIGKKGTKVSREVATVSVPKDKADDLLAMVSKPGEASRIITAPKPAAGRQAPAPAVTGKADEPQPTGEASATSAGKAPSAGAPPATGARPSAETAALPSSSDTAGAAEPPAQNATPEAAGAPVTAGVRVDAVEVEGDNLYVAGAAKPGATVRVYADDAFVGQDKAGDEGRYVVNGTMPLSIGRHTIRADLVDPETGKVTVRADVPFDRPEGNQLAAVSPREVKERSQAGSDTQSPPLGKLGADAQSAMADLRNKVEAKKPQPAEIEAARKKAEKSLQALVADEPGPAQGQPPAKPSAADSPAPPPSDQADTATSDGASATNAPAAGNDDTTRDAARAALAMLKSLPAVAPNLPLDQAQLDAIRAKVAEASKKVDAVPAAPSSGPGPVVADAGSGDEPKTIQQPALTTTDDFVIIRRGDTLWQIARRQYGHGVRYTTIYLANSDQISNPDLILPGQVFDVPQKSEKSYDEVLKMHHELMQKERGG